MSRVRFPEAMFRKASRSSDNPQQGCVELVRSAGEVDIRDSKTEFGSEGDIHFRFSEAGFDALQERVRELDLRTADLPVGLTEGLAIVLESRGDMIVLRSAITQPGLSADAELVYTRAEIEAFFDGVHKREFDEESTYIALTADCAAGAVDALV